MFRAVCHSSSGAPTVFATSGLHTHVVTACSVSASLVKPDGCVRFVQFSFGVLISLYFCGLFGIYKFNIYGSVHCSNLIVITNEMQLGNGIYYSLVH